MVWAGVSFIIKIGSRQCSICVKHVGGTIRSCQRAIIRYDRRVMTSLGKMPVAEDISSGSDDEDSSGESESDGGDEEQEPVPRKQEPMGDFVAL